MTRRLVVIGVLAAALFSACGSSGSSNGASSAQGKKYVDAMVSQFDKEKASGGSSAVPFTHDQALCLSKKMIDTIGVDKLQSAGVTPANIGNGHGLDTVGKKLTTDQASKVAALFFNGACFDMSKVLASEFETSFKGQPKGSAQCLANEVMKLGQFKQAMTDSILGKSSSNPFGGSNANALLPAFTKCHIDVSKLSG